MLNNSKITIYGNNNLIKVGSKCRLHGTEFWIEDEGGCIEMGDEVTVSGSCQLAAIEGCKLKIGSRCLFSTHVQLSTGDSHSILNNNGKRINPSKDITISDHVWSGHDTTVLKGVLIGPDSIVGACSVVTKSCQEAGVVLAGNPAKVVKRNINWNIKRI